MIASLFANVPFDRHQLVHTADLDEARHRIGEVLNSYRLQILRGRIDHSRLELMPCGPMSLIRLRHGYGADISIDPDCGTLDGYYLLVLPTRGRALFTLGGCSIDVSPQAAVIVSPGRRFHFTASHDYEQILLRLERQAIDEAWCRLTARDQAPSICFDAVIPIHTPGWQALMPLLQWVSRCAQTDRRSDAGQAALLGQIEMLLATTLLLQQPHDSAATLWPAQSPVAAQSVQRAQAYMLAHMGDALPVGMVASHCGLSVRHMQALFKDECGQSPLQWLRMQRLQAVRQALQADDSLKVGDTALRFGFTHLGEFSRAYRQAFGETPQQTRGDAKR